MRTIDEIINSLPLDRQEAIKTKSELLLDEYNNRKYIGNILLTVEELGLEDYLDIVYSLIELMEINNNLRPNQDNKDQINQLKQGVIDKLLELGMK